MKLVIKKAGYHSQLEMAMALGISASELSKLMKQLRRTNFNKMLKAEGEQEQLVALRNWAMYLSDAEKRRWVDGASIYEIEGVRC